MTRNDLEKQDAAEREAAHDCALRARRQFSLDPDLPLAELVRAVYGLSGIESHLESGKYSAMSAILPRPVVTVFPYSDPNRFERAYGYSPEDFTELCRAGFISPIIQQPTSYDGLDYLHPILRLRPPSYFLRASLVYAILAGDDLDYIVTSPRRSKPDSLQEFMDRGRKHQVVRAIEHHPEAWEPYQGGVDFTHPSRRNHLIESYAFKFAQACCFIGEDVTESLLSDLPRSEALRLLTHLHVQLDHPIAQGLLTTQHHDTRSVEYAKLASLKTNAFELVETTVDSRLYQSKISVPIRPTINDLDKVWRNGIPELINQVRAVPDSAAGLEEFTRLIGQKWALVSEIVDGLDLECRRANVVFKGATFILSAALAVGGAPMAAMIGTAAAVSQLPERLVELISERLKARIRAEFVSVLWQTEIRAGRE